MNALTRRIFAALLAALACAVAHAAPGWPQIPLPPQAVGVDMGDELTLNGLTVRTQAFTSPERPARVTEWFKARLGQPLVQQAQGPALVLGRLIDGFYVTVQIESAASGKPGASGTRGLIGITDLASATREQAAYAHERQALIDSLPAGSRLLSHSQSLEGGVSSTQWLFTNGLGTATNEAQLLARFQREGLTLQRRVDGASTPEARPGVTLFLAGAGREVNVALQTLPGGQTLAHVLQTRRLGRAS